MSTTTEIEVPRALLDAMLYAQGDAIYWSATDIHGEYAGETKQPWRANEDAMVERMTAALEERAMITHALDTGATVPVEIVRAYVDPAIAYYDADESEDLARRRAHAQIHRDLCAWRDANGFARAEEATA